MEPKSKEQAPTPDVYTHWRHILSIPHRRIFQVKGQVNTTSQQHVQFALTLISLYYWQQCWKELLIPSAGDLLLNTLHST